MEIPADNAVNSGVLFRALLSTVLLSNTAAAQGICSTGIRPLFLTVDDLAARLSDAAVDTLRSLSPIRL
jgi:hypothetical protein